MKKKAIKDIDPSNSRAPQDFMSAAIDFEMSKTEQLAKSEKRAWMLVFALAAITLIAITAFFVAVLFRVEPEPTIIEVDKNTGITNVRRSVKDVEDHYDEVVNIHFLEQYVTTRERYDWNTISADFDTVKLMSSDDIAVEYSAGVQAENSPLTLLKDQNRILAKVTSVSFVGEVAQIRFTKQKIDASGYDRDSAPITNWIASIAFEFDSSILMTQQERMINPLGFKAFSYRVVPEVSQ